jgi:hypothetical protein
VKAGSVPPLAESQIEACGRRSSDNSMRQIAEQGRPDWVASIGIVEREVWVAVSVVSARVDGSSRSALGRTMQAISG